MDVISSEEEWWWIDFLESELDPALDKDLQTLLEHSREDRRVFETFRVLKCWLKESDPAVDFLVEKRLPSLREKIMSALPESGSPGPAPEPAAPGVAVARAPI